MTEVMMIYQIPDGKDSLRISFNRKVFNYNIQSHSGKYQKKSQGLLSIFEKPTRSCVIFEGKYLPKIRKICQELGIQSNFYEVKRLG